MSVRGTISEEMAEALAGLKDFQRTTVDYVFDRLYSGPGRWRYLVADEVGLGKTMIARGVIARAIDMLRSKGERTTVVYVCSNGDIARQNINRLRVGPSEFATASRLTLLPRELPKLASAKTDVSYVSFTPGTSFELQSGLGQVEERLLLYAMLRELWELGDAVAPMNVFQGNVADADYFRQRARAYDLDEFDPGRESTKRFGEALRKTRNEDERPASLRARFDALCQALPTSRSSLDDETRRERSKVVGEFRTRLAASCIAALKPSLVILDEFQRFSHLLDGDDDASLLARELFNYPDARVLLLSATPYKMYTTADEASGEDHYRDFVRTVRFLEGTTGSDRSLEAIIATYRKALLEVHDPGGEQRLVQTNGALAERLRRVMVRTERLASTPDRNGMLEEVVSRKTRVEGDDVAEYLALQRVADLLEHDDVIEYWKSAPFLLNFMDEDYKLKRTLDKAIELDPQLRMAIARELARTPSANLSWDSVERYGRLAVNNGRYRELLDETVGKGAHRLLWVPPSLPYYELGGEFAEPSLSNFTKRLVFSSWRLVPRVLASLLSYEAERMMVGKERRGSNTAEARRRRRPLLKFTQEDGRLTGMPVLALMYPSACLARACDPALLAVDEIRNIDEERRRPLPVEELLSRVREQIEVGLRRVAPGPKDGRVDERWYWAAPLLLDKELAPAETRQWFEQENLSAIWAGIDDDNAAPATEDGNEGWLLHAEEAKRLALGGDLKLGRRPDDLVEVLAQLAVGGPGVTMLRAMLRVLRLGVDSLSQEAGTKARNGAARAAWGFRGLFNQPEVMSLLRPDADDDDQSYWRCVLVYCVDGCLQSVLDEYAHVLRDHLGLTSGNLATRVHEIADEISVALSLRAASLAVDELDLSDSGRTLRHNTHRMRCHFALRFGDEQSEDGQVATRADSVRKAFNSPFWPFVLATTSVGQEGLDFHTYCHAVVHWNLPSNPVDLEQREGRVHRYKGHAVRKNVARRHGRSVLAAQDSDVWELAFDIARQQRAAGASDIVPYWVYPVEGGAKIERHVASLPLSRERERLQRLKHALAVYRMVFGQPRQDDLLGYLLSRMDAETLHRILNRTRIDLSPTEPVPEAA